jgi:plasmid stability protein
MATLTIKNIPDAIYRQLKRQAVRHHRNLNQEVIACLQRSTASVPFDPSTVLAQARKLRKEYCGPALTDKRLLQLKTASRP